MANNLFYSVAIESPSVVGQLNALIADIQDTVPRATWTQPDKWHITLQFLGDVPELQPVERMMRASLEVSTGSLRVKGAGTFLNSSGARMPRVLFAKIDHSGFLNRIRNALGYNGQFNSHLTLAKLEDKGDGAREFYELANGIASHDFGESPVTKIELLRTQGEGRPYMKVAEQKLTGTLRSVEAF